MRESLSPAVAFARSLLQDRVAAEDVVHDCFCRLLRRADIYDLPSDGTKLLFRAVTNACINHTQRTRKNVSLDDDSEGYRYDGLVDGKASEPSQLAQATELAAAIERGLARLSVTQRAAVELKSFGHSLDEIADTLGLTISNVGVLIHRARQTLSADLAGYLGREGLC